jgi:hypothetical protein
VNLALFSVDDMKESITSWVAGSTALVRVFSIDIFIKDELWLSYLKKSLNLSIAILCLGGQYAAAVLRFRVRDIAHACIYSLL